jgi:CHAT domain-containing protein/tetratricopeptide (TPR) repeat protein
MTFDRAEKALRHGQVSQSQDQAAQAYREYRSSNPAWAWKFRILEAQAALERGLNEDVLKLLKSEPLPSDQPDVAIPALMLAGVANVNKHNFREAELSLVQAAKLCDASVLAICGYVLQARGLLASEQSDSLSAETFYELSLSFARAHRDSFLESNSLLNLGAESLAQGRYDEAIDRSEAAYQVAKAADARILELDTQGNIGWAYYKLGDADGALDRFLDAEKRAADLGDVADQGVWLTNAGYVYLDARNLALAEQHFRRALQIEQGPGVDSKENIYNALRALARVALQTGDLENASQYAQQALEKSRESGIHVDELYPMLVQGQVAARRGDVVGAERTFHEVEQDKVCPVFLKWEAEHSLARLYEDEKRPDSADREYRAALATFEAARDTVRHQDSQLSFLTNASRIYDDYVHFLVVGGKTDDALRWADYSRARTLAEGLGLLAKGASTGPPPLNPQQIARRAEGTVLFYWLGEKQSYLWAITPQKTNLFTLPPGSEIEAAVERYRKAVGGPQDVLDSADQDGLWLYRTLIAPAQELLGAQPSGVKAHLAAPKGASDFEALTVSPKQYPDTKKDAKVFVIPDGSLNNLNFETLLVTGPTLSGPMLSEPKLSEQKLSGPKLHYWIEDVTVANASSLRVLGAARAGKGKSKEKRDRSLLLVGNSVAPNDKYPELPKAAAQMESVARHFPASEQWIFTREQATPAAYLASSPEQFSYIHFVAHGTASRLSPLDSAIVLSKIGPSKIALSKTAPAEGNAESDSFKLYARDIIRHPLRADLVTISACYGAGERAYSGEGLVGLSWAFLRAGAHNVVAALWEATDASTEQLMDKFYDELNKGAGPDAALRAAKLSLLRGGGFHNPFYWAPFQLYAGS